jgi:hypothetical protein
MATATRVTSGAAQYATFFLNGMYFGVPVLQVQPPVALRQDRLQSKWPKCRP